MGLKKMKKEKEPFPGGQFPRGSEPVIFELSSPGREGVSLPDNDVFEEPVERLLPSTFLREDLPLPEVAEIDVVRHFTRLSQKNFAIATVFFPLGSCTMKYNPMVHEEIARDPGWWGLHPYQPESTCQGALRLLKELEAFLCEIGGMDAVTLQPSAGAQGELVGLLLIRAYLRSQGQSHRKKVLVPQSAHGTNPATAARCGYEIVEVKSDARGRVDLADLDRQMDDTVAALMLTNPNTLGLFEDQMRTIAEMVHGRGGQMYCDGANLNAILGYARPGDMGFDVMHFNVHKTFSTPHGAGGPGAGPVAVKKHLEPFLPIPRIKETSEGLVWDYDYPQSIGKIHPFYGNFMVLVRAYAYIRTLGPALRKVAEDAVLNANYLLYLLKEVYPTPYPGPCMHEFVVTANPLKRQKGIRALDIAKRLLDYGFHPPTIYFPLIVPEALMIEPTETESQETLSAYAQALLQIAEEDPETVRNAPYTTPVLRLDEARAAREPNLQWEEKEGRPGK